MVLRWWDYFWNKRDQVGALNWKDAELARIVLRIHRHRHSVDWTLVPLAAIDELDGKAAVRRSHRSIRSTAPARSPARANVLNASVRSQTPFAPKGD